MYFYCVYLYIYIFFCAAAIEYLTTHVGLSMAGALFFKMVIIISSIPGLKKHLDAMAGKKNSWKTVTPCPSASRYLFENLDAASGDFSDECAEEIIECAKAIADMRAFTGDMSTVAIKGKLFYLDVDKLAKMMNSKADCKLVLGEAALSSIDAESDAQIAKYIEGMIRHTLGDPTECGFQGNEYESRVKMYLKIFKKKIGDAKETVENAQRVIHGSRRDVVDLCNKGFQHIVARGTGLSSASFQEKQREEARKAKEKLDSARADLEKRKRLVIALQAEIKSLTEQLNNANEAGDIDLAINLQQTRAVARQELNRANTAVETSSTSPPPAPRTPVTRSKKRKPTAEKPAPEEPAPENVSTVNPEVGSRKRRKSSRNKSKK